jgi:hypothetical protein
MLASFFDVFAKLPNSQNYYKTNRKTMILPFQAIIFRYFFAIDFGIDFCIDFGAPWRPKGVPKATLGATFSTKKTKKPQVLRTTPVILVPTWRSKVAPRRPRRPNQSKMTPRGTKITKKRTPPKPNQSKNDPRQPKKSKNDPRRNDKTTKYTHKHNKHTHTNTHTNTHTHNGRRPNGRTTTTNDKTLKRPGGMRAPRFK